MDARMRTPMISQFLRMGQDFPCLQHS